MVLRYSYEEYLGAHADIPCRCPNASIIRQGSGDSRVDIRSTHNVVTSTDIEIDYSTVKVD